MRVRSEDLILDGLTDKESTAFIEALAER